MEKIARKIFQPNRLTNMLLDGVCDKDKTNLSHFINKAIEAYYTPLNAQLEYETSALFVQLEMPNENTMSQKELKATLARCVEILKDYPIKNNLPLRQIISHFTNKMGRTLRYDYINIVDYQQDKILHHLNDVIKTVDSDYVLGTHEFGERCRYVFSHWDELYQYSEIYIALATIIECEDIYYPLDAFTAISLIKLLDRAITESAGITPIKDTFPTNISNEERYYGIRYEIAMYYTDNGYSILSGDDRFANIPPEIQAFFQKFLNTRIPIGNITENDVKAITSLESEGRLLFKRLAASK